MRVLGTATGLLPDWARTSHEWSTVAHSRPLGRETAKAALSCFLISRERTEASDNLTRATAFGNRTLSGQRRELQSDGDLVGTIAEEKDDEMAAMAKVWAHPEDLHKYPVLDSVTSIISH